MVAEVRGQNDDPDDVVSCCSPGPPLLRPRSCSLLQQLTVHLQKHSEILVELEKAIRNSRKLEVTCREFEQQKVCYLPLNVFLLRPLHRLMHYKQILERLCKHYPPSHVDFRDSRGEATGSEAHGL